MVAWKTTWKTRISRVNTSSSDVNGNPLNGNADGVALAGAPGESGSTRYCCCAYADFTTNAVNGGNCVLLSRTSISLSLGNFSELATLCEMAQRV